MLEVEYKILIMEIAISCTIFLLSKPLSISTIAFVTCVGGFLYICFKNRKLKET